MNLLGSPNWISGLSLCMGNTAVINRMTYGWYPGSDYENTSCIVYFGHNPKPNVWCMENDRLMAAQKRGAKLIVLDPCESYNAKRADIHLPLRAGTDAAMASVANNTLMQYANQKGIYDGIMNLDLFVVLEHFMTPTAQLADYVLPGDAWIERPNFVNGFDNGSTFMIGQKLREAPGGIPECL